MRGDKERDKNLNKKQWYCRDYNRDGCSKNPPHTAWFGSGASAVKRQVVHGCAVCLLKEKTIKEHPQKGIKNAPTQHDKDKKTSKPIARTVTRNQASKKLKKYRHNTDRS